MVHLKNRDAFIMTVAVTAVGFVLAASLMLGFHGWIGAIVLMLSVKSWMRENLADKTAANLSGDPTALASALNKLPQSSILAFLLSPYSNPPTAIRVWYLKRLVQRSR